MSALQNDRLESFKQLDIDLDTALATRTVTSDYKAFQMHYYSRYAIYVSLGSWPQQCYARICTCN